MASSPASSGWAQLRQQARTLETQVSLLFLHGEPDQNHGLGTTGPDLVM